MHAHAVDLYAPLRDGLRVDLTRDRTVIENRGNFRSRINHDGARGARLPDASTNWSAYRIFRYILQGLSKCVVRHRTDYGHDCEHTFRDCGEVNSRILVPSACAGQDLLRTPASPLMVTP